MYSSSAHEGVHSCLSVVPVPLAFLVVVHDDSRITAERPLPSIFVIVWQFDWRMFLVILRLYRFVWVVALAISLTALACL